MTGRMKGKVRLRCAAAVALLQPREGSGINVEMIRQRGKNWGYPARTNFGSVSFQHKKVT